MHYIRTNWEEDIKNFAEGERPTIVFTPSFLKVYGEIPYRLKRRLNAQFHSNPAQRGENNYTSVDYSQSKKAIQSFFDWMSKGDFEWFICLESIPVGQFWYWDDEPPPHYDCDESLHAIAQQTFGVSLDCDFLEHRAVLGDAHKGIQPRPGDAVLSPNCTLKPVEIHPTIIYDK